MKRVLVTVAILAAGLVPLEAQQALTDAYLYTPPTCSVSPFSDVTSGDSYCPWIKQLKTDGITAGCGGGAFCPDAPVTHEQLAMLLERAMRGTATWEPWRGMFQRILIVSPVPGDSLASGQRLLSTVDSITGSGSSNTYLVFVEPGRYDLDDQQLTFPPYVTLRGSGIDNTLIEGNHLGGAVIVGQETAIEDLQIRNAGPWSQVVGIDFPDGSSGTVRRAEVNASGGAVCVGIRCLDSCTIEDTQAKAFCTSSSTGVLVSGGAVVSGTLRRVDADGINGTSAYGMNFVGTRSTVEGGSAEATFADNNWALNLAGNAVVEVRDLVTEGNNSEATDVSAGVRVQSGFLKAENSRFESDDFGGFRYGLRCLDGEVTILQSRLIGANATVWGDPDCTIDVAGGQLAGGAVNDGGGTVRCALNYSENLNAPALTGCF